MKQTKEWLVRMERQPHRDAVRRLREAYRKLWEMNKPSSAPKASREEADQANQVVQEAST
jgi:hypothetical protein